MTNVARHAGARSCRVRLSTEGGALELEVSDDGVGLPEGGSIQPGVGLSSMRERARELGGTCEIRRGPRGGTRVLATLPLEVSDEGQIMYGPRPEPRGGRSPLAGRGTSTGPGPDA